MTKENLLLQSLSAEKIDTSVEIKKWLEQFTTDQKLSAKLLLSRLYFVSRDIYAAWIEQAIIELMKSANIFALYSVRKLEKESESKELVNYWDEQGRPIARSGESLGSEDLVYSLISNLTRTNNNLLDHPSLSDLKQKRVRNYILIDDSIGSGERVYSFINSMLKHPTFLSWWSLGWIKIHVVSFARPQESEKNIIKNIVGSDHEKSKCRKSSKITFTSKVVYQQAGLKERWGQNYDQISQLCKDITKVPTRYRLGYGTVFSNFIFYHSVPNNIPGIIWYGNPDKWEALMPGRVTPEWLINLLELPDKHVHNTRMNDEILNLLKIIKRGVRKINSIAQRLSVDSQYAQKLIQYVIDTSLVTENIQLTARGLDILHQSFKNTDLQLYDYSMYIPTSWCTDQKNVQPLMLNIISTESIETKGYIDGDIGEISLEKSDDKAVPLPFSIEFGHVSSATQSRLDTNGPPWGPKKEK